MMSITLAILPIAFRAVYLGANKWTIAAEWGIYFVEGKKYISFYTETRSQGVES